jgi:phosphocarrier protein FPr
VPPAPAADPEAEWRRLEEALARVRQELDETRRSVARRAGEYAAAIFDAHVLLLADETLVEPARRAIFDDRRNAADAWSRGTEAVAEAYAALEDEYQRARADDVLAVGRAVVAELVGGPRRPTLAAAGIVVALDLTPADTAALDARLVRGIATAYGGPTSHSAILARSLGLPAVVGLGEDVLVVPEGAELLLDGDAGLVYVEPDAELVAETAERERRREQATRVARRTAAEPAETRDGRRIEVAANIGSPDEVEAAVAAGADGVGLLRTEFLFLERAEPPGELAQAEVYAAIAERLDGRPLVVRTLDVGGDKPLPWLPRRPEANPFLGVRGIRLGLAEPELLETQLRALLRVAARHPLKVMFPMVATLDEYRESVAMLERLADESGVDLARTGKLEVGVMVEVPSAALSAELFAPEVDFFSLGTNDLSQYTMAAERGSRALASLADALQPPVLRLVGTVADAAAAHGKWVGVCGEIASDPLAVPLLLGLGVTELSVAPPAVPAVKQAVRGVDLGEAEALAEAALGLASASDVRALAAAEPSPYGA